jgi:hypothetical protein
MLAHWQKPDRNAINLVEGHRQCGGQRIHRHKGSLDVLVFSIHLPPIAIPELLRG